MLDILGRSEAWLVPTICRPCPRSTTRLSAQFEQPVFGMNVGLGALRHSSWSSAAVIQASEHLLLSYLYSTGNPDAEAPAGAQRVVGSPGDEVTTEMRVPAGAGTLRDDLDRYALVAHDPPSAFLACCQFWKLELQELSQPVLIVIAAPMTAPGGAPLDPDSMWPGCATLGEAQWPVPDEPSLAFAGSIDWESRPATTSIIAERIRTDYCDKMVLSLDGAHAFSAGWTFVASEAGTATTDLDGIPISVTYKGPNNDDPTEVPDGQLCQHCASDVSSPGQAWYPAWPSVGPDGGTGAVLTSRSTR